MSANESEAFLGMSDDDIINMQPPAAPAEKTPEELEAEQAAKAAAAEEVPPVQDSVDPDDGAGDDDEPPKVDGEDPASNPLGQPDNPPAKEEDKTALPPKEDGQDKDKNPPPPADKDEGTPKDPPAAPAPVAPTAEQMAAFWNDVLGAPIRANGKDIQLKNPEEAKRAIQMGLNYTKKLEAMQPHLRVIKMLDNNKLLGEAELSYLIDLHQKKPEAIQKLLADSEFDPNSVDVEKAAKYVPGNHQVSDREMQFQAVLDEVESSDTGAELILEVAKQWDDGSRKALFEAPHLLVEFNKQKASGLYALISDEVARRKTLGEMQGVPFIAAYETVGKEMVANGTLIPAGQTPPVQEQPKQPVATRVVTPKATVTNNEKAKAASPTKETAATVKQEFNPLAVSDEEFLKQMQGRL